MRTIGAGNVTANTNRPLGSQASLALTTTTRVGEKLPAAICRSPRENAIGDQLFE